MNASETPTLRASRATRSSLACVPCRARHVKCDGNRPSCTRCGETAQECHYAPSRRGGLDRAALAERRRQRLGVQVGVVSMSTAQCLAGAQQDALFATRAVGMPHQRDGTSHAEISSRREWSFTASRATTIQVHMDNVNVQTDRLLDSYCTNFHKFHPFLLPRTHLIRLYQDPNRQLQLKPLIAVMRLIGNIYASQEWSIPLKDYAETCLSQTQPTDPILVQCRLLYSIALFWTDLKIQALHEMDEAIRLAVELEMYEKGFSARLGRDDPVLMECWRRTWWMLYIVDTYYSGTLGYMRSGFEGVEATVDLPCEEAEYESGNIPQPRTLQEFDNREFAPDATQFSSFAYLIGAVRCTALSISEGSLNETRVDSVQVIQRIDSVLNAWLLLLPKNREQVMTKTGDIDELMFQAHLLIHVATIALHRPFSDLKFNPAETLSSCVREPPTETSTPELANIHTLRVLRSIEDQIQLLALPVRHFQHSPFVTCMVSTGTMALLSACKFLHRGMDLTIARNQIRMTIGRLNALGEVWSRAGRNVGEIQSIARHVLGLGTGTEAGDGRVELNGDGHGGPADGMSGVDADVLPLGNNFDLCGWYNVDLDLGDLWEVNNAA